MGEASRSLAEHLPELLDFIRGTDIEELEIEEGELRLRLRRTGNGVAMVEEDATTPLMEETPSAPTTLTISAPLVGTFYSASQLDAPPFVTEGSRVEEETVVGVVEALNVLTPVEAGCRGVITARTVEDGQAVEYGQLLFEVAPGG